MTANLPANEELRLQDLYSYHILDTPAESDFDELVELASQICRCPISLITLVDKDRQWFKAKTGVHNTGTPRDVAFCAHAILQDGVMMVEDATRDLRFKNHPFVTGEMNIRFYAGAPILSPTGHKLGTICLVDHKPRSLSTEEEKMLKLLANQVSKLLDIRKKNHLIRKKAEEIIALKSQSFRKVIREYEEDKKHIAHNLHEDFAQSIASSIFYLRMAEDDQQKPELVKTARTQLEKVLLGVRNLSYQLTPPGIELLSCEELISEFVEKVSPTYSFAIEVEPSGESEEVPHELMLVTVRIIGAWLEILGHRNDVNSVSIHISVHEQLIVTMKDDAHSFSMAEREKAIVQNAIYDKTVCYQGFIKTGADENTNALVITLPLVVAVI